MFFNKMIEVLDLFSVKVKVYYSLKDKEIIIIVTDLNLTSERYMFCTVMYTLPFIYSFLESHRHLVLLEAWCCRGGLLSLFVD